MAFTPFIKRKVCTNVVSPTFVPFIERVRCTPLESAEVSNLSASNVVMGNPVISSPAIGQGHSLSAINVETQNVAIGIPELVEIIPTFIITINTALGTGDSFQLPLPSGQTYNFVVDWGDGNEDTITSYNQAETLHNYSGAFNGQISITGKCGGWAVNNTGDKLKITTVDNWGDVGFDFLAGAFFGCTNLTSLPDGSIPYSSNLTNLSSFCFLCTSLTALPNEMFKLLADLDTLSSAFRACPITTIDSEFLKYNTNLISLVNCFYQCNLSAIPVDFLRYNVKLTTVNSVFIFNYNLSSIPNNLFYHNPLITNYQGALRECRNIVMPAVLFNLSNLSIVTTFSDFMRLANISHSATGTIQDIWNYSTAASSNTFLNQTALTNYASIPAGWK